MQKPDPQSTLVTLFSSKKYWCTDDGQLWSLTQSGRFAGKVCAKKGQVQRNGYLLDSFWAGKKHVYMNRHRIVWVYFKGPVPANKQVNHINGNKLDNALSNLELVTASENIKHAYKIGKLCQKGEKNNGAKLTDQDVLVLRCARIGAQIRHKDLASIFNITKSYSVHLCKGKFR
jgi:hypothetical protein